MGRYSLQQYSYLLQQYLTKKISAKEFETKYLKMFKYDDTFRTGKEFQILDRLFNDVDAYCDDPALIEDTRFDINESELRKRAERAYSNLKNIQSQPDQQ